MVSKFKHKAADSDLNHNHNHYTPVKITSFEDRLNRRIKSGFASWLQDPQKGKILIGLFIISDFFVLFSVFDLAYSDRIVIKFAAAITCAMLLNVLLGVAVECWKEYSYRNRLAKEAKVAIIAAILMFVIVFSASVFLRIGNLGMDDNLVEPTTQNAGTPAEVEDRDGENRELSNALMLCVLPLATSVMGAIITFLNPRKDEREIATLRLEILELQQQIAETEAALATMPGEKEFQFALSMEEEEYTRAVDIVNARMERLRAQAAQVLMEKLATPSSTTSLNEAGIRHMKKEAPPRLSTDENESAQTMPGRPVVVA